MTEILLAVSLSVINCSILGLQASLAVEMLLRAYFYAAHAEHIQHRWQWLLSWGQA